LTQHSAKPIVVPIRYCVIVPETAPQDSLLRNSLSATTAAVQSFPGFPKTLGLILSQRRDEQAYIPYYVF